ncbi:MAG TPA: hypothetical protein VI385_06100 [Flavisolibacter sp.]
MKSLLMFILPLLSFINVVAQPKAETFYQAINDKVCPFAYRQIIWTLPACW